MSGRFAPRGCGPGNLLTECVHPRQQGTGDRPRGSDAERTASVMRLSRIEGCETEALIWNNGEHFLRVSCCHARTWHATLPDIYVSYRDGVCGRERPFRPFAILGGRFNPGTDVPGISGRPLCLFG